jgi:hypothetical protein
VLRRSAVEEEGRVVARAEEYSDRSEAAMEGQAGDEMSLALPLLTELSVVFDVVFNLCGVNFLLHLGDAIGFDFQPDGLTDVPKHALNQTMLKVKLE